MGGAGPRRRTIVTQALVRARAPFFALAFAALTLAAPRPSTACSYEPFVEPLWPRADEQGVATNAKLWFEGTEDTVVTLTADGAVIDATVAATSAQGPRVGVVVATPTTALLPGVQYTVSAKSPRMAEAKIWKLTTAAGPNLAAPGTPALLSATARRLPGGQNSCDPVSGVFGVTFVGPQVPGATLYQLEVKEAGGFAPRRIGLAPTFSVGTAELPSPVYRIRPISMSGAVGDEALLPTQFVASPSPPTPSTPNDGDLDAEGACSSSGGAAGASFGLLLALGLLATRRSRRRRVAR